MTANREYKDSVFSSYFGENNARMVELYNAIENKNYPLDTPVVKNTLEDALYKDRINDLSFVLDGQILVLLEHQSTINNNMALRMLMYVGRLYEKIVNENGDLAKAIYGEKQLSIPVPKLVVLYNGKEDLPEHTEQYLSDLFMIKQEKVQLELKIDVYNINYNKDSELLNKSQSIYEYSTFIHCANEKRAAGLSREEAVKQAMRECIESDIMAEYLLKNGSEVTNMLYFEWKEEDALKYAKEEGYEDGFDDGKAEGKAEGAAQKQEEMIRAFKDVLSPEVIAEKIHEPVQYVLDVLKDDGTMYACEKEHPYNNK